MKSRFLFVLAFSTVAAALAEQSPVFRTWTDAQNRKLEATFRGIENGQVFLQVRDGFVYRLPMEKLSAADQEAARTLKPEGLGIPADPRLAQAAMKIDELVGAGLEKAGRKPNPLASDEQFVRRVYLDIAGRIPTRDEAMQFIEDTSVSKRSKLIDSLLESGGYNSHFFNYFADMLRLTDSANKVRYYTYQDWLKEQIAVNRPWDELVHEMMTADGELLENGATGYLLRDAGMRLDNMSLTLSTFLGANVSCAQCHDHPFAEWTQREFYEMAAFFGTTETYGAKGSKGGGRAKMMKKAINSLDNKKLQSQAKNIVRVNLMSVEDTSSNKLKLPDDYMYDDGAPGDPVSPRLIGWGDETTPELVDPAEKELRTQFADWMTSPENPRFAMAIANRLWKRAFGIGVREPVSDLDDPEMSVNPPLLRHLAAEMVRLEFDMKQFMRLLYNTQTYQREATSYELGDDTDYLFSGPVLRRMSAEQAWDSCATLVVGADVDVFKDNRGERYAEAMSVDLGKNTTPKQFESQIQKAVLAMRANQKKKKPATVSKRKGKKMTPRRLAMLEEEPEEDFTKAPPRRDGLVLARASELPQPEKDQHFLRMFGQSDREICDSSSEEGSIPQVLMLMNGEAQEVIGKPDSLAIKSASAHPTVEKQIEDLYLSFFSRHPRDEELGVAVDGLNDGLTLADLSWVLFNTREFVFVE